MIDLHCHILPGLDDGPSDVAEAVEMGRVARDDGISAIAATPHIREDYPFPLTAIEEALKSVQAAFAAEGIGLEVTVAGEVALTKIAELDDATLQTVCLGVGPYLLVESPYSHATGLVESTLFDLQVRGFRPVLAHPERSPGFLSEPKRLRTLVERGILCSVTSGSFVGRFGRTVQRFALDMVAEGSVHNVASDAHDSRRRAPVLRVAFDSPDVRRARLDAEWLTQTVPAAILAGDEIPPRPAAAQRASARRRFRRRR